MDLREIGTILREERERQGLTLDAVSNKIKITRTCLAAIEEGNEGALPHPVYAKGFIKNYARLLGVDQETFLKSLAEVYQPEEPPLQEVPLLRDLPDDDGCCEVKPGAKLRTGPVVAVAVGLILLAGLGWYVFSHISSKSSEEAPATTEKTPAETPVPTVPSKVAPIPESAPSQSVTPPAVPEPKAETKVPTETSSVAESKAQVVPTPEDRATQDIATSGPTSPAASAVPPAATETAPTASSKSFSVGDHGAHVVSIVAKERCWLQAGADGGTMRDAMLEKGETFTGRFADYLLVRLGNAGAVEIRFDNKLYPLQAGKGSVKTLRFVAKKNEDEPAKSATSSEAAPASPTAPASAEPPVVAQTPAAGGDTAQGAKEVEIYGQDGSWVIVSPDKGPAKEIYVKKGQRITVPFGDKIEIKLGNPSNVVFRYDGKETPVSTEKGGVKTIRFP